MRVKGLAQPLADAAKLLAKISPIPLGGGVIFLAAPAFSLAITLGM